MYRQNPSYNQQQRNGEARRETLNWLNRSPSPTLPPKEKKILQHSGPAFGFPLQATRSARSSQIPQRQEPGAKPKSNSLRGRPKGKLMATMAAQEESSNGVGQQSQNQNQNQNGGTTTQQYQERQERREGREGNHHPIPSRNPIPLSASQEAQVRDVFYARVRDRCQEEIKGIFYLFFLFFFSCCSICYRRLYCAVRWWLLAFAFWREICTDEVLQPSRNAPWVEPSRSPSPAESPTAS